MTSRWQYFPAISLGFLVGLTVPIALFIYRISPLRNPTFVPDSGNAGTLISRFRLITEQDWIQWATMFAGVLAVNSTIVLWQQFRHRFRTSRSLRVTRKGSRGIVQVLSAIGWVAIGTALFTLIWITFVAYLLIQWIID
ncbi:hypothetical protein [Phormidesmis priestleyi]